MDGGRPERPSRNLNWIAVEECNLSDRFLGCVYMYINIVMNMVTILSII